MVVVVIGNNHEIKPLIRGIDPRKPHVIVVIKESDASPIHFEKHRLEGWAEFFKEQIN